MVLGSVVGSLKPSAQGVLNGVSYHSAAQPTRKQQVTWFAVLSGSQDQGTSITAPFTVENGVAKADSPPEVLDNAQPLWHKYLVGYFIGDDAPHIGKVHATVNRLWSSERGPRVDAQYINPKTVLFKMEDDRARQRVLSRHIWHIADVPLIVKEWTPRASDYKPDMSMLPIWVELKKVPDRFFTHKGLMFLGNLVGNSQKLHPTTERCVRLDVARILVIVNLENELPKAICLDSNEDELILVSYPWLPPHCDKCKAWGHLEKKCFQVDKGINTQGLDGNVQIEKQSFKGSELQTVNLEAEIPQGVDAVEHLDGQTAEIILGDIVAGESNDKAQLAATSQYKSVVAAAAVGQETEPNDGLLLNANMEQRITLPEGPTPDQNWTMVTRRKSPANSPKSLVLKEKSDLPSGSFGLLQSDAGAIESDESINTGNTLSEGIGLEQATETPIFC